MTAPDADALEAARAAATGGVWTATSERADGGAYIDADPRPIGCPPPWVGHASRAADAAYIVAMHNALPDLLAAVRERDALRAGVAELAGQFERDKALGYTHSLTAYVAARLTSLLADVDG